MLKLDDFVYSQSVEHGDTGKAYEVINLNLVDDLNDGVVIYHDLDTGIYSDDGYADFQLTGYDNESQTVLQYFAKRYGCKLVNKEIQIKDDQLDAVSRLVQVVLGVYTWLDVQRNLKIS